MTIGIITFHCAHNYGAVLQAFGLQSFLKSIGHEVYVVDYRPKYKTRSYAIFSIYHWISKNPLMIFKRQYDECRIKLKRIKRWKAFDNFISNRLTLYQYSAKNDFSNFDFIIVGSDQIWNKKLTGGEYDPIYFGANTKCKTIAYAASNRASEMSETDLEYFRKHLEGFHAIGVREDALNKILSPLTSKKIETVLDPTILAGRSAYEGLIDENFKMKGEKYVLVYEIERHKETRDLAQHIANIYNLELVELVAHPLLGDKSMDQTASPEDFVNYIHYSTFIVTTSFHGVAFSIMFNKPFYAIRQNTSADIRIESLLNHLNLLDRFVDKGSTPDLSEIDYNTVYMLLSRQQKLSEDFLNKALK